MAKLIDYDWITAAYALNPQQHGPHTARIYCPWTFRAGIAFFVGTKRVAEKWLD